MNTDIHINPKYQSLQSFIEGIPDNFDNIGEAIHLGRNQVRIVEVDGIKLVIKYFKRITSANRIIYATLRKTKAQRSFENSNMLLTNGIGSPEPVAYIDTYNNNYLKKSYYICLYCDFKAIKTLFSSPLVESEEGLRAFARLTNKMHQAGIFHGDFNLSNVLYKFDGTTYEFSLIDNNRMNFKPFHIKAGLKNLRRMKLSAEQMGIIGTEYARVSNIDDYRVVAGMILFRYHYIYAENFKIWIKSPLRKLRK